MAINVPPEEVNSFCAFLYGIRFKPDIKAAFHVHEQSKAVMDAYGLSADQQRYVWALDPGADRTKYPDLNDAQKASMWASLVALLLPEFYDWTYGTPPYWW